MNFHEAVRWTQPSFLSPRARDVTSPPRWTGQASRQRVLYMAIVSVTMTSGRYGGVVLTLCFISVCSARVCLRGWVCAVWGTWWSACLRERTEAADRNAAGRWVTVSVYFALFALLTAIYKYTELHVSASQEHQHLLNSEVIWGEKCSTLGCRKLQWT